MEDNYAATTGSIPEWNSKMLGRSRKWLTNLLMIVLPVLLCISLLLVLMLSSNLQQQQEPKCSPSAESKRSNLADVLKEIQHSFFHDLHKQTIYRKPGVTPEDIRTVFRPYDPRPSAIRHRTEKAASILRQLNALKIDITLLKMRERKALHVARAILRNNFGWMPYTQNYNIGDWMLGPDIFCWQPICNVFLHLNAVMSHFKPYNMKDLETLKVLFEQHNETFERYIENVKLGVRSGYVRSFNACQAGLHNLHYVFYRTVAINNESGVYEEPFSAILLNSGFFEHMSADDNDTWTRLYNVDVTTFFNRSLLTNIARPAVKMLRYLEKEHVRNCVPATIASGLGSLPLPYSYTDGIPDTSKDALNVLPTGEKLVGKHTYEALMSYFTTIDIKPALLREKAVERLKVLYNEAVEIAKLYTNEEDNITATVKFSREIQASDMLFNSEPFPSNESGDAAFIKCFDAESAKAFCPERWKALQAWIQNTVETMKLIRPTIKTMFYETGPKRTVPACPIEVLPWFHPHGVFHSYYPGTKDCSVKARQGLPFFTENYGPKWTEYTTTAHEQLPGHHLEVMSYTEYFEDDCGDAITWMGSPNYFPGFTEGWSTYVEYKLLPQHTKLYENTSNKKILRQKYGMIYYQILAALRAIVDIDLNYNGKTKDDALQMYKKYVWEDNTHQVQKDIARMQSAPGIVTSYMIGEMEISRVRAMTERDLGADFSSEEFHYQVLRQGEYPLDYLEEHMKAYIACKKDPTKAGCKEMLQ